ncbi:MAG: nitrogen regulation protein NR(I) [Pseudomonadota bacterium]
MANTPHHTILVADDDASIRTVINRSLSRAGYAVRTTGSASTLWRWVHDGQGDLVITDVVMPDENIFDLLPRFHKYRPDLPIIVMSAQNTLLTAVNAAEHGAYEYLPKPFDLDQMASVVQNALKPPPAAEEPDEHGDGFHEEMPLVGRSQPMQEVYRVIARLAGADLTVLITGESGTGKELAARALHDYGRRAGKPFVAVNLAAIPREQIEAELFGAEPEAEGEPRRVGRLESALGGTLFLDEIGDMPPEAQTRLLRVLQEGEHAEASPGGAASMADVRIIAATNQNIRSQIDAGDFREDLYFRLNVVPLKLPALRERSEDVPDLVRHFLLQAKAENLPAKTVDKKAMDLLTEYDWPGNVRELRNLVRRLTVLYSEDVIGEAVVAAELEAERQARPQDAPPAETLAQAVGRQLADYFATHGDALPPPGLYHRIIREVERPLISMSLDATRGNQLRASELLGLNRNTLRKKIRELDIAVLRGAR